MWLLAVSLPPAWWRDHGAAQVITFDGPDELHRYVRWTPGVELASDEYDELTLPNGLRLFVLSAYLRPRFDQSLSEHARRADR